MSWDLIGALGNAFGGPIGGIAASAIGGLLSNNAQQDSAQSAANAQLAANRQAMDFQQNQYNQNVGQQQSIFGGLAGLPDQTYAGIQQSLAPYLAAGQQGIGGLGQFAQTGFGGYQNALQGQQALAGALGADAQSQAIAGIQGGPCSEAWPSRARTRFCRTPRLPAGCGAATRRRRSRSSGRSSSTS
jgi:hypothetical protein